MSQNIDWTTLPFNYSTSEVDTGWTYQDGKHIFKRTVVANITTTRNTIVLYNTNISGVANIIRTDGWWANYQNQKMQIGAYFGGQYSCPYIPDNSSIIHIGFVADSDGSKPFQATFYYTKN